MFNAECYAVWVDSENVWECAWCGFSTTDDDEARWHGMTGMEMVLDELEIDD